MMSMKSADRKQVEADCALIRSLGGPTQLAKLLGYDKPGSVQRVQNWTVRGIPPAVKLAYPHLFLASAKRKVKQTAEAGAGQ